MLEGAPGRPAALAPTMHYRRAVALLIIALMGLALCGPDRPDDGSGAVRHGRHVGRPPAEGLTIE